MKAPKAWPQVIEIPPTLPDQRNADPAATTKLSAFDLEKVVARASEPRTASVASGDHAGDERQTAMTNTTSEEALLANLKRAPSPIAPVIQDKEPLPGSLDAGWEDEPSAVAEAEAKTAPPPSSEGAKTAPPPSDLSKTAPPPPSDVAKTAPPPGLPTPLLPGPIVGADGIVRLSDPDDEVEEQTKVGDSLVESMRGGGIANLADEDEDEESAKEGLTVVGNSLVQSGMIDAPDVAALTAMRPSDEPKVAAAADAPAPADVPAPAIAMTISELPKLGEADDSGQNPSVPPLQTLDVAPASKREVEGPAPSEPAAALARPAWMSTRYAVVAVLLALATLFVAMRMLQR